MPYKIKVWIPVEEEDVTIYSSRVEAQAAIESMKMMQPENIYTDVECNELGKDI